MTDPHEAFQFAYASFNARLFQAALPPCLITLNRKEMRVCGYYSSKRFSTLSDDATRDEIAMNPMRFKKDGATETLQTLAHEMVHCWQYHHGTPCRRAYHDMQWSAKMEAIGLMPSDTGRPGGARVGQRMADYPIPGGRFERAARDLIAGGWSAVWYDQIAELRAATLPPAGALAAIGPDSDRPAQPRPNSSKRSKFQCPRCEARAWGAATLQLICGRCAVPLTAC